MNNSNYKKTLGVLYLILNSLLLNGQIIKIGYDSIDIARSSFAEFTILRISSENKETDGSREKYPGLGFSLKILGGKVNPNLTIGLNLFYDVHYRDWGYEKSGIRFPFHIRLNDRFSLDVAPGFIVSTYNRQKSQNIRNHYLQGGSSSEVTLNFAQHYSLTSRFDIYRTRNEGKEIDLGLGLKIRGKYGLTVGGLLGIFGAALFNIVTRSV